MNKEIKVFVAGSKDLRDERNTLKILANDLCTRYQSKGYSVAIYSYENLEDDQGSYNSFIKSQADITLFVVSEGIGSRTEEEFREATNKWNTEGRPEVIVFVKSSKEVTPEIARFEGLMQGRLSDRYHVDYSDLKDLRAEAKERLVRYIDERIEKDRISGESITPTKPKIKHEKSANKSIRQKVVSISRIWLTALTAAVLVLSVALIFILTRPPKTTIMFAGGGSAANYILQQTGIDLFNYEGGVYANMPSENAWPLLSEAYYRYRRVNWEEPPFVTVCVSASKIDPNKMLNTFTPGELSKKLTGKTTVVECLLGYDTLAVYIQKDLFNRLKDYGLLNDSNSKNEITPRQVAALIRNEDSIEIKLFSTSLQSGTTSSWQKCLEEEGMDITSKIIKEKINIYNKESELSDFSENKNYIILGSTSYFVDALDSAKNTEPYPFYTLYLKKKLNEKECLTKPIYLYFVAPCDKDDAVIPKPIWKFLNTDGMKKLIGKKYLDDIKKRKITPMGLITRMKTNASEMIPKEK